MKNFYIKSTLLTAVILLFTSGFSAAVSPADYSYSDIEQMALKKSEKLQLQQSLTSDIKKEYDYYIAHPLISKPIAIEYKNMQKFEYYSDLRSRDFEEIYKNEKDNLKNFELANKEKSLKLFTDVIRLQNNVKKTETVLENEKANLKAVNSKYENGLITKAELNNAKIKQNSAQIDLNSKKRDLSQKKKELKEHAGLKTDDFVLTLDYKPHIRTPEAAAELARNSQRAFLDMKDNIDKLNTALDDIYKFNLGPNIRKNIDEQEKLIDEAQKDYNQMVKDKEYSFTKMQNSIQLLSNELLKEALELKQANYDTYVADQFYKNGLKTKLDLSENKIKEDELAISMLVKKLQIELMLQEYETAIYK